MNIKVIISWLKGWFSRWNGLFLYNQVRDYSWKQHRSSTQERKRIVEGVRRFFEQNYELRYNILKQTEEFRPRFKEASLIGNQTRLPETEVPLNPSQPADNDDGWQQLTDRELRRMTIEQMEQVGAAWSVDVELYVRSALVPSYSPVTDYLEHCEPWDGYDHIRAYARRVPTNYVAWPDHFHRWMLATVAQWMNLSHDYGNSMVPLLIGSQGTRKSTFCKQILPQELRAYYIDDIKLENTEQVERMLGKMLLVDIDEYNAKTDREQAKIKRILTEKDVQARRMRSDHYELRPRMASFIATTNEPEPLCDPTGSRRFLCCEVMETIDTEAPIDHRQLYAQAVSELNKGERWYFTKEEEAEIECHNMHYQRQSSPEMVVSAYFEPAERGKAYFVLAVDIQNILRQHLRPTDVPSMKALTMALKSLHFPYGAIEGRRGWYARQRQSS